MPKGALILPLEWSVQPSVDVQVDHRKCVMADQGSQSKGMHVSSMGTSDATLFLFQWETK